MFVVKYRPIIPAEPLAHYLFVLSWRPAIKTFTSFPYYNPEPEPDVLTLIKHLTKYSHFVNSS